MKVIFKFPYYDVDKNGTIEHEEFLKQLKNIDDWFGDNFVLMKQKFAATDFNGDGALRHDRKFQLIERSQISIFFSSKFSIKSAVWNLKLFSFQDLINEFNFYFIKKCFLHLIKI